MELRAAAPGSPFLETRHFLDFGDLAGVAVSNLALEWSWSGRGGSIGPEPARQAVAWGFHYAGGLRLEEVEESGSLPAVSLPTFHLCPKCSRKTVPFVW